jgi:hypothetical protein
LKYFNTRDISAISLSASLWAIVNWLVAPIFWNLTHLPILCDMLATSLLILTVWWIRKPGAASFMGILATILNFILRPGALHFLGFTVASILFDLATAVIGHNYLLNSKLKMFLLFLTISFCSTFIAGFIIGSFFMNPNFLTQVFGGLIFFASIHGAGGLIGGSLGLVFINGLEARGVLSPGAE